MRIFITYLNTHIAYQNLVKDLTKGNEARLIWNFALPMFVGNVFQQLYQIINSIIVGKYIGKEALAAVGASFPIMFSIVALVIGVGMGGTVVISQYFGIKQFDKVKRASDTLMVFLVVAGFIFGLLGIILSTPILNVMSLPAELMVDAKSYLNINMMGMFALFGYNAVSSVLRGMGDSKTPLYFLFVSIFVNLGLDFLFVLGFGWGIKGVAWATVIAYATSWLLAVWYLNKTHSLSRFSFFKPVFDWQIFKQSLRIGLPSGIQQTFVGIGSMALMSVVNGFGVNVIAAYTAASRIDSFVSMPAMNFSAALSAFVGQNLVSNHIQRIKNGFRSTLIMSAVICAVLTVVVVFFGDSIMRLFIDPNEKDIEEVVRIGHEYLVVVCSFYILFSTMFVINGLLRGAGATVIPMFTTLFSLWLIRLPVAYFLSQQIGEKGIWWSIPIGWGLGMIGAWIYYLTGKWKNKAVVKAPPKVLKDAELGDPNCSRDYTGRV
jgi:putative MATE family efflux protein